MQLRPSLSALQVTLHLRAELWKKKAHMLVNTCCKVHEQWDKTCEFYNGLKERQLCHLNV